MNGFDMIWTATLYVPHSLELDVEFIALFDHCGEKQVPMVVIAVVVPKHLKGFLKGTEAPSTVRYAK